MNTTPTNNSMPLPFGKELIQVTLDDGTTQSLGPIDLESIHLYYKRFDEEEVELILDSDTIDYIKRSLSTFNPDNNVINRIEFENHLKKSRLDHHPFPKVEVDHQKRKIWDVVKLLGSTIKEKCTFKY